MLDQTTCSVVLTHDRCDVHYAPYPHIFIEDSDAAPASVSQSGKELKRYIPVFFSRKDGCALSGRRVPMGEFELVAAIGGKHPKSVKIGYLDGCVVRVESSK